MGAQSAHADDQSGQRWEQFIASFKDTGDHIVQAPDVFTGTPVDGCTHGLGDIQDVDGRN
jgi:hypothetical protein